VYAPTAPNVAFDTLLANEIDFTTESGVAPIWRVLVENNNMNWYYGSQLV